MSSDIRAKLNTTLPGLSMEIGTPERKIIDAVGEAISEAYVDQYVTGSLLDINSKSGLELEQFCLVPGTPVVTPTGIVPIEQLRQGDEVITHTGQRGVVLATSDRLVDEEVVTLRSGIGVEHTMTPNHPVLVTRRAGISMLASQAGNWRRDGSKNAEHAFRLRGMGNRTVWDARSIEREWVPAGEVMPGDIVWGPEPAPAGTTNSMTASEKRLAGYYLAEGHVVEHRGNLGFSFHEDEVSYHAEVDALLRSEWGIEHTRIAKSGLGRSVQVNCWSKELCRAVVEQYGSGADGKHIPWSLFDSSEDLAPLLATYWNGDGTAAAAQTSLRAKTVSVDLAHQIFTYMLRLGLNPRLARQNAAGEPYETPWSSGVRKETWQVSVDGDSALQFSEAIGYPLRHQNDKDYAPSSFRHDGFVGSAVVSATRERYEGSVHNIEVEGDNSYLLLGNFAVHNCGLFGFGRLQGRAATGTITLTLTVPATALLQIPLGTQFYASNAGSTGAPLYFASTQAVVFPVGATTVSIPAQCTVPGTIGNVAPNAINSFASAVGASSATNLTAFTGGVDVESDVQLRSRFINTFLRNIAGTKDFYLAQVLQSKYVSRSVVFGPVTRYRTQMVVPNVGVSTPIVAVTNDIKYVWAQSSAVFQNLGSASELFFTEGVDYTISGSGPGTPNITVLASSPLAAIVGQIVDVEFEHTTNASRNDPANTGITNAVDVFIDGTDPYTISETNYTTSQQFLNSPTTSTYYYKNFVRDEPAAPGTNPSTSNTFMRLGSAPLVNFPSTVTIGANTYTLGTHYYVVKGVTNTRGSVREVYGLEWIAGAGGPAANTAMTITYTYNRAPQVLDAVLKKSKQICTDISVHESPRQYLIVNLNIEYDRGFDPAAVNNAIQAQLRAFFGNKPHGSWVFMSDIILVTHQVLGVLNVVLTSSSDNPTNYGVQSFAYADGMGSNGTPYTADFKLADNQLGSFLSANLTRKPVL